MLKRGTAIAAGPFLVWILMSAGLVPGCSPRTPPTSVSLVNELSILGIELRTVASVVIIPDDLRYGPDPDIEITSPRGLSDIWTMFSRSIPSEGAFRAEQGGFTIKVLTTPARVDGVVRIIINMDGRAVLFFDDNSHNALSAVVNGQARFRVYRCPELLAFSKAEWQATLARDRK